VPQPTSLLIFIWLMICSSLTQAAEKPSTPAIYSKDPLHYLKILDLPHPYCEGKIDLSVGKEYFVEIANDLPGREEYNQLIVHYRKAQWELLDSKWKEFRQRYSDSPLMEPGAFLYAQTEFDRIIRDDGLKSKEAERHLRELTLMYPQSELTPVLRATAASFFLRNGSFQKALSLYQTAERDYAEHPLSCVFTMGDGETNFMMRAWPEAAKKYRVVADKCNNIRLKVAAMVRAADSEWLQGLPNAQGLYEKVIENQDSFITRFFPSALYNLGEIKYREGQLASAKFYFDQYIKTETKDAKCIPHSIKRMADIAFRTGEPWEKAAGLYLATKEQSPNTDVGRFSYIHGLLIGLPTYPRIEYQRRLKVIDSQIDEIQEESWRSLAYLEKGLALLDAGEKSAMDYLVRLTEKADFRLKGGELANFVRDRLLKILKAEVETAISADDESRRKSDMEIFQPIEAAFGVWLKGSEYETAARKFYNQMILRRFEQYMSEDDFVAAIEKLERWHDSPLWDPKGPEWEVKLKVGELLAEWVFDFEGEPEESPAYLLLKKEKALTSFLEPEFHLLWAQLALDTGDNNRLKKIIDAGKGSRSPASVDPRLPSDLQSHFWLVTAESFRRLKRYPEAEQAFGRVKDESFQQDAIEGRLALHLDMKNFGKAYADGKELLPRLKGDKRRQNLSRLLEITEAGKLWKQSPELLSWAKESFETPAELVPFYFQAGRAFFELGQFRSAIEAYESGLKGNPEGKTSGEARYRLGRSLVKDKRVAQARAVFLDLIERKDPFWSPLASNEIKSLK